MIADRTIANQINHYWFGPILEIIHAVPVYFLWGLNVLCGTIMYKNKNTLQL